MRNVNADHCPSLLDLLKFCTFLLNLVLDVRKKDQLLSSLTHIYGSEMLVFRDSRESELCTLCIIKFCHINNLISIFKFNKLYEGLEWRQIEQSRPGVWVSVIWPLGWGGAPFQLPPREACRTVTG